MEEKNITKIEEVQENPQTEQEEEIGKVKISDEVISIITTMAAGEVAGVHSMSGTLASGIVEFLGGKKSPSKGIKVAMDNEGNVAIEIHISVVYGYKIPDVAWEIQAKVKKAVEEATGLNVTKVNVHVDGVYISKGKVQDCQEDCDEAPQETETAEKTEIIEENSAEPENTGE